MSQQQEAHDKARTPAGATEGSPAAPTRCVLWIAAGSNPPQRLLDGLHQRQAQVTLLSDATAVMAELLEGKAHALIVQEPAMQSRLRELLEAVRHFRPQTICWGYRARGGAGQPELARLNGSHEPSHGAGKQAPATSVPPGAGATAAAPPPSAETSQPPETPDSPAATAAERPDATADDAHAPPQGPWPIRSQAKSPSQRLQSLLVKVPRGTGTEPLISEDELAMLLGPVPPPDDSDRDTLEK